MSFVRYVEVAGLVFAALFLSLGRLRFLCAFRRLSISGSSTIQTRGFMRFLSSSPPQSLSLANKHPSDQAKKSPKHTSDKEEQAHPEGEHNQTTKTTKIKTRGWRPCP
jgi:hypothetical protein